MMKRFYFIVAATLFTLSVTANQSGEQSSTRIDPTLEITANQEVDLSLYPFIELNKNEIQLNGRDWTELQSRLNTAAADDTLFSIVYLGDSHIQADFGGSVVRSSLADAIGSAGRGIIIPFRIAGTNQPLDYTINTVDPVATSRLLKEPWATTMPFTGIGVQALSGEITLHITCKHHFDRIRLLWAGEEPTITAIYGEDIAEALPFERQSASTVTTTLPYDDIHLCIASPVGTVLAGVVISSADAGTFVHSIGNNGATYATYNQINGFGTQLASLKPDLVVVALGTNEAFGTFTHESLLNDIDILVNTIRSHIPNAEILLVTPSECYRRKNMRKRNSRLIINKKVVKARDAVCEYAHNNNIPLYDTYEILGGTGAAKHLKNANLLGRDGIHFTSNGYRLQGALLAAALLKALTPEGGNQ